MGKEEKGKEKKVGREQRKKGDRGKRREMEVRGRNTSESLFLML